MTEQSFTRKQVLDGLSEAADDLFRAGLGEDLSNLIVNVAMRYVEGCRDLSTAVEEQYEAADANEVLGWSGLELPVK